MDTVKNKILFLKKVINLHICYKLNLQSENLSTDFIWSNSLFGFVKPNKNLDLDKYKYRMWFSFRIVFTDGSYGKSVIVNMSSSVYFDIKNKDILILVKDQHKD